MWAKKQKKTRACISSNAAYLNLAVSLRSVTVADYSGSVYKSTGCYSHCSGVPGDLTTQQVWWNRCSGSVLERMGLC